MRRANTSDKRVAGLRRARLRPAAVPCRNCKFKIQKVFRPRCPFPNSGRSLRRPHATLRSCGPPRPGGCGPHGPDGPLQTCDQPAAERRGVRLSATSPPPGGGCGLPVAVRPNFPPSALEHERAAARLPACLPASPLACAPPFSKLFLQPIFRPNGIFRPECFFFPGLIRIFARL